MRNLLIVLSLLSSIAFADNIAPQPDKNGWLFVTHHVDNKYKVEYTSYVNTRTVKKNVAQLGDTFIAEKIVFDTPIDVKEVHNIKSITTGLSFMCGMHSLRIASMTYYDLNGNQLKTVPILSSPLPTSIGPDFPRIEKLTCGLDQSKIPELDRTAEPPVRQAT